MIKAVIFDVDGVLLDSFEANFIFFERLMAKNGFPMISKEDFRSHFHRTMRDAIKVIAGLDSEEEIDRVWLTGKNREVEYPLDLLSMPKGAESVIKKLSKSYQLAIVTSRIRTSVFESPSLAKHKKHFKEVVCFEDTILHKPNPEPLLLAAEKLGNEPSECVYIGDTESDLRAAKAAGMKIIIFSHNKIAEADASTNSFIGIPDLVRSF